MASKARSMRATAPAARAVSTLVLALALALAPQFVAAVIPAGRTVVVDAALGNDSTCAVGDLERPCRTIAQALALLGTPAERSHITVRPGHYAETAVLPGNVDLSGEAASAVSLDQLVINGSAEVSGLTVNAVNRVALTVQAASSDVVRISGVHIVNAWTAPSVAPVTIDSVSGSTTISGATVSVKVTAAVAQGAAFVRNGEGAQLALRGTDVVAEVTKPCPVVALFESRASAGTPSDETNLFVNYGQTKLQVRDATADAVLWRAAWSNVEVSGARANLNVKRASTRAIAVHATGDVTAKVMGGTTLNFKAAAPDVAYALVSVPEDGAVPDVRFIVAGPARTPLPRAVGDLSRYTYAVAGVGGLATNSALRLGARAVSGNYTPGANDALLLVAGPNARVSLPAPGDISPGSDSDGRMLWIKNANLGAPLTGVVLVSGPIWPDNQTVLLLPRQTASFFSHRGAWHVVSYL